MIPFSEQKIENALTDRQLQINALWWQRSDLSEVVKQRRALFSLVCSSGIESEVRALDPVLSMESRLNRGLPVFTAIDVIYVQNINGFLSVVGNYDAISVLWDRSGSAYLEYNLRLLKLEKVASMPFQAKKKGFLTFLHVWYFWVGCIANTVKHLLGAGFSGVSAKSIAQRGAVFFLKRLYYIVSKIGCGYLAKKIKYGTLSEKQFYLLDLVSGNPLHELVRSENYALISNDGLYNSISELIFCFSEKANMLTARDKCVSKCELLISNFELKYPQHYRSTFWDSSNSFYFLNILVGFRVGIPAYDNIGNKELKILSNFDRLDLLNYMSDEAIEDLFRNSPITVQFGRIHSGRHRALAMVGHIIRGKRYIPIYYKRFDS